MAWGWNGLAEEELGWGWNGLAGERARLGDGLGWGWAGLGLGEGWAWAGLGMGGRALAENTPVHCSTPSTTLKQEISSSKHRTPTCSQLSLSRALQKPPHCFHAALTLASPMVAFLLDSTLRPVYLSVPKMFPLLTCLLPLSR